MKDLPTKRITTTDGAAYPGVLCEGCGAGIALLGNVAALPETFSLTCPTCSEKATYRKAEIQTLEAHRKQ